MSTRRRPRILQLLPADGWWIVYDNGNGTVFRDRVIAFALVDYADDDADRAVLPVTHHVAGYLDVDDADNALGVVHADDWPDQEASFVAAAQDNLREQPLSAAAAAPTEATR
jgi:hypothetical protein